METPQLITEQIYTSGFSVIDNFLPQTQAEALLSLAQERLQSQQFLAAKIGNESSIAINKNIRQDRIFWLDEDAENNSFIQAYFKAIKAIAFNFNQALYLGIFDLETHIAYYAPGAFYKKHVDQFLNKQNRKISWVYYLNLNWQKTYGGHLSLYDTKEALLTDVYPLFNRLVCFKSDLPHEVNLTLQERFSITGWMKTRATIGISE